MEVMIDDTGAAWRIDGNTEQVTILRRAPVEDATKEPKWRAVSYHNRLDQALSWLLDHFLRTELAANQPDEFLDKISAWKRRLEAVSEYWRQSVSRTVYEA